jgi:hypothetical protein
MIADDRPREVGDPAALAAVVKVIGQKTRVTSVSANARTRRLTVSKSGPACRPNR